MLRVAIYGPLPPLKGGISRHTQHLADALAKKTELTVLAPNSLYFQWLYPGHSQVQHEGTEQKSTAFRTKRSNDFELMRELINMPKVDLAIIPWWTSARFVQTVLASLIFKSKGSKVMMICHNFTPHSGSRFEKLLTSWALRLAHHHTVQSKSEAVQLRALLPTASPKLTPHPAWPVDDAANAGPPAIPTFLFFGYVREYKGIRTVVSALDELEKSLNLRIIVMGEVWDQRLMNLLRESSAKDKRLTVKSGYVDQDVAKEAFRNCSAVLLPYLSATGSGVLADAKSHKVPVIASNIAPFNDEVKDGVDGLLVEVGNAKKLASAIQEICKNKEFGSRAWEQSQFDWDDFADEILQSVK